MKFVPSFLVFAAVAALIQPALAKELAEIKSGCSIKVPENWEIINFRQDNGYSVAARSADKKAGVTLFVSATTAKDIDGANDYLSALETFLQQSKMTIQKKEKRTLGANTFEVFTCVRQNDKIALKMNVWVTVANNLVYKIELDAFDPSKTAELDKAIQSFTLL